MSDQLRVLILIDHLGVGGAQAFLTDLCRRIPPDTIKLTVCALSPCGYYAQELRAAGIFVHEISRSGLPLSPLLASLQLLSLLRVSSYNIVHTFLQQSFVVGTPVALLVGASSLHTVVAVRRQTQWWYFPCMAVYQRLVSAFLSFNPMELSQAGIHSAKVKAVELTPELDHMLTLTRNPMYDLPELDLRGAFPVVLSVARLHPDKGHEYAIRAWPRVAAQWPRGRLLIVGAGEDDARLRRLAAEFMVADTVIFAGHRSDLAALFTRADINLRTSINEGVNFITIQAMAAGLPIIGLQVGAAKEVIKHMVTGLLVAVGDSGALADAINLLCVDADLAQTLGSQARTQVRSYYSIDKIAHIYTQMYRLISMGVSARQIPDMSSTMEEFDQIFSPM